MSQLNTIDKKAIGSLVDLHCFYKEVIVLGSLVGGQEKFTLPGGAKVMKVGLVIVKGPDDMPSG